MYIAWYLIEPILDGVIPQNGDLARICAEDDIIQVAAAVTERFEVPDRAIDLQGICMHRRFI
jgi:hypothetical protein